MKLTAILLTAICLQAGATGFSQDITLSVKGAPLKKVFRELERQSGMTFYYKEELLDNSKKINLHLDNVPLTAALEECVVRQGLSYVIIGKTIVIKAKEPSAITFIPGDEQTNFLVSGIVTEESSPVSTTMPLPGASVTNKNTKQTVITDYSGKFTILASTNDVLLVSFVGYLDKIITISATENTSINIRLTKTVISLDEAVVVGYGTTKKKDLTGSVSTIDGKDIKDVPFLSFDNAMAGKAAGVQVTKTDGTPGGAVRVRVRGSTSLLGGNDPLYVIDGVPVQVQSNYINTGFDVSSPIGNDVTGQGGSAVGMTTAFVNGLNSLGGLNPDDIESISILKDASSAAIYGSKAANGVVLITTKKGKKDMRPRISFGYYTTYNKAVTPTVLNTSQYKMLITEAAKNAAAWREPLGYPLPANVNAIINNPDQFFGKANTDWIKEVTRNSLSKNAEVSVAGGSSSSKYFTSISYTRVPGVIKNSDYQRITGKITLENEIGSRLKFMTNLIAGYIEQDISNGAYSQALRARPDIAPYDSTGEFTSFANVGYSYQGFQNPTALLTALNNSKTFSLLGSVSGTFDITKDLQFKSIVSLNSQTYNQRNYTPSYVDIGSFYGSVSNAGGIGSNSNSRLSNWFIENTLTYSKKFNKGNSLNIVGGTSYETRKNSFFSATATGFPDDNVLNNLSSANTLLVARGDDPEKPQSYLLSFYLRANYSLLDKYLFTFTGRADGSSKFGTENKFGYFPSGAFAWRVSEENFLKNVSWLSDFKLRTSYGLTGTQNIGDQMYRTLYSPVPYGGSSALIPTQLGNAGIKWETTKSFDAGADITLFNNRLQFSFDFYQKKTDGALLSLPIAPSSSYSSLLNNTVDIKNKGYEFYLSGEILRTKNFRWSGSVNLTFNKSVVTRISEKADLGQIGNLTGLEYGNIAIIEGKPLGLLRGMNVTGLIRDEKELEDYRSKLGLYADFLFPSLGIGDPMFTLDTTDASGFGYFPLFNDLLGEAAPKYVGGLTQSFSFKNFDLNLYFTFSHGGKLFWGDHVSSINFSGTSNANTVMLGRYTQENPTSKQPRLVLGDQLLYNSNLSIFNSSYFKLRTISLNYNFSQAPWMNKVGLQHFSVFASAMNVFTITKYPGNDPETSDDPYSVAGGYFDVSNYPLMRSYSIGIKADF